MNEINLLYSINIFQKLYAVKKNKNIKDILNIDLSKINYQKIGLYKKTLFVCTHDYCFIDILTSWIVSIKSNLFKNTHTVVRESFISLFSKFLPGAKMLERNNDTTKKMIEILKNNENILIFYSRRHLKYLNIDKIVKEVDIDIVPVRITSNTIEPVSHNRDGILENIDIYLQNKFSVEILNKVDFNKEYNKEKFIEI